MAGRGNEPVQVKHESAKGIIMFRWKLLDQVGVFGAFVDGISKVRGKHELVVKDKRQ